MFTYIKKKINFCKIRKINESQVQESNEKYDTLILVDLKKNLDIIRSILSCSSDLIIREFNLAGNVDARGAIIYIDGMVDKTAVNKSVIKPLMYAKPMIKYNVPAYFNSIDNIVNNILTIGEVKKVSLLKDLLENLLCGNTILLVEGSEEALIIDMRQWNHRGVEEPLTESIVRGSREGFTENIQANTVLLRRIIKDPDLCLEALKIGDKSRTKICIAYLKDIAKPELIKEVKVRLKRIHIDAVLESGYIEQFIEDAPLSIFSTVANSERPDKVASKILEGKVGIFIDGTPFVLTVPMLFIESFHSSEDYYSRTLFSSLIRLLRFLSFLVSILAPATYVSLTVFHQELIPTPLLISIAAGRQQVPFPAVLEAGLMIVAFDILREAGVRLPKPVGSAISMVGALVIGQSAVEAGLVSPIMVIVVSLTAICSFVVPPQADSGTILRYVLLVLAGIAGGFGVVMGLMMTLVHLATLRSFGIPYLWPVAPLSISGLKDTFIRMPIWSLITRPKLMVENNLQRQEDNLKTYPKQDNNS